MHVLDLILDFENIFFRKVNISHNGVRYISFKFFLSPPAYEIVGDKLFKSWFQVLYQINWSCFTIFNL
jgi:hypothetical protein